VALEIYSDLLLFLFNTPFQLNNLICCLMILQTPYTFTFIKRLVYCILVLITFNYSTCKYGFKDSNPPPPDVKTFRVSYFENKAQYVNPQLAPQLTEKMKQKIINTTRLKPVNTDEADYDIAGYVSDYYTTTTGISGNNASQNRLNISFHLNFKNNRATDESKKFIETEIPVNIDFPASQTLSQAEQANGTKIITNIVDAVFNKIFSNW
jgi:Lipopolysaccharide-assembly